MRCVRLSAVLLAATLAGCQRTSAVADLSAADIAAIRDTSRRFEEAVQAGHWEDAVGTFTEDAILRFPNAAYEGRAAILKYLQSTPPWPANRALHIDEIRGRGDLAFVAGYSATTPVGGGAPVVVGHYLDIRLRQPDGSWFFYRDMVSPVPAPATGSR